MWVKFIPTRVKGGRPKGKSAINRWYHELHISKFSAMQARQKEIEAEFNAEMDHWFALRNRWIDQHDAKMAAQRKRRAKS